MCTDACCVLCAHVCMDQVDAAHRATGLCYAAACMQARQAMGSDVCVLPRLHACKHVVRFALACALCMRSHAANKATVNLHACMCMRVCVSARRSQAVGLMRECSSSVCIHGVSEPGERLRRAHVHMHTHVRLCMCVCVCMRMCVFDSWACACACAHACACQRGVHMSRASYV